MALLSVLGGLLGQGGPVSAGSVGMFSVYSFRTLGPNGSLEMVTSLAAWMFNALINVAFAVVAVLLAASWLVPRQGRVRYRQARGS